MNDLLVSSRFVASADSLPKESRAKLPKLLKRLSLDPRSPGLQLKKMKATRPGIYEARLDRSLRVILEFGDGVVRLLDVGAHDETLRTGERVQEGAAAYGLRREDTASYESPTGDRSVEVEMYLAGDDCALSFRAPSGTWLGKEE